MALRAVGSLALLGSLGCVSALRRSSPSSDGIYVGQEDACMCMNWREAYKAGLVKCGKALEFYLLSKKGITGQKAADMLGDEFCGKFFTRINDNFCVNVDFTKTREWSGLQWCYVSADCEAPSATHLVKGTNVRWKICNDSDTTLRKKSPEELDDIRGSQDLDLGLLSKFAYPIWQDGRWPELEQYFLGAEAEHIRKAENRKDLDAVVAAGSPVLFDSKNGHPPFHVVVGQKIYKINFKADGRSNYAKGRMGDVNEMACIQGC